MIEIVNKKEGVPKALPGTTSMALAKAITKYGVAVGCPSDHGRSTVFRGVPYAQPPVGDLRFRAPKPPEAWQGERVFDTWAPECIQINPDNGRQEGIGYPASEDCLHLNVWTPAQTPEARLPVLVWLHGSDRLYEDYFVGIDGVVCRKHLILVTPVWRCGVFGYFGLEEFEGREEHNSTGCYGILDILAALRWVQENIAAFGGDPDLITLAGHSSGGTIVKGLVGSEVSRGLFRRAIIMSAGGIWDVDGTMPKREKCRLSRECMELAGLTVDDMLHGDAVELSRRLSAAVSQSSYRQRSRCRHFFLPSADDYVFYKDFGKALFDGSGQDVEILCGTLMTEWEDLLYQIPGGVEGYQQAFAAAEGLSLAQRNVELGHKPVYHYFFNHCLPGGVPPYHGSDLQYVFGRLNSIECPWSDYDFLIENALMDYCAHFVRNGDPNAPGYPRWPPYTKEHKDSLHITEDGLFAEDLTADENTAEATRFLLKYPGVIDCPFLVG